MLAFVLSRRDFREYDQIVSLYTLEKGKMEVLARGVKKILSKNAAHLEPFCLVEAEIIQGKEINHLGSVAPIELFKNIRKDLKKSLVCGCVVKTFDHLLHNEERDRRIFDLSKSFLEFIEQDKSVIIRSGILLDALVIKLFNLLGFDILAAPQLDDNLKKEIGWLSRGHWRVAQNMELLVNKEKKIHDLIYKFAVYHSEKGLKNWSGIA